MTQEALRLQLDSRIHIGFLLIGRSRCLGKKKWECWLLRGSKTGGSVEKPTKQGQEPTITATDVYHQIHHYVDAIPALKIIAMLKKILYFSLKQFGHLGRSLQCPSPPRCIDWYTETMLTGTKSYMTKCSDWGRGKGGGRGWGSPAMNWILSREGRSINNRNCSMLC